MSFFASCAISEPSTNSTNEWTADCGWMTTSIFSAGRSKRKCASMISRPLFIIVAESIVIFGPIFQVGCASASSTVIVVEGREVALAEGAARGRQHEPRHLLGPAAAQRLVDRAVLGIDRDDLRPAARARRAASAPPPRRASPCWRARAACPRPRPRRPSADPERRRARRRRCRPSGARRPPRGLRAPTTIRGRDPGGQERRSLSRLLAPRDGDELGPVRDDLLGQLLDRAPGGERDDTEAVGHRLGDVERRAADRSGGAEDRQVLHDEPSIIWSGPASRREGRSDAATKTATTGAGKEQRVDPVVEARRVRAGRLRSP